MEKQKRSYLKRLGQHFKKVRQSKGYSQDRLYLESGISRPTIFRIEGGRVDPRASTMRALAETMGVPVKKLFDFE